MSSKVRSYAELLIALEEGERFEYIFFWGHKPRPDGRIGPSCFSQWWPSPFQVDGREYATAEHWMMAGKARMFGDEDAFEEVLRAKTPAEAKKIGRRVRNFDQQKWSESCNDLVMLGNLHKFASKPELGEFLLSTDERVLVEASPADRIWGIGLKMDHPDASRPQNWRGQNLLGFALMEVREALRDSV